MTAAPVREVSFEDVGILKHALGAELRLLSDKSEVAVSVLAGLNGQVLSSYVPDDLPNDLFRLLSLVLGQISRIREEIVVGRIEQSVSRYATGNVVITRVGHGELLISALKKEASVTGNLPQIFTSVQVLSHISSQREITSQELSEYPQDVRDELSELTQRLYAELETKGTLGELKKNKEILARFEATLDQIVGKAESQMIMAASVGQLGIATRQVSPLQWRQLTEGVRQAVQAKAGRYYAELAENQLQEIIARSEELF